MQAGAYQLVGPDDGKGVQRVADGAFIPPDPANRDWQDYLAWKGAGLAAVAAPEQPRPTSIDAFAFFGRFHDNERVAVQAAVNASPPLGVGLTNGLAAHVIDLTDPVLAQWMAGLVAAGAITKDRAAEITTP